MSYYFSINFPQLHIQVSMINKRNKRKDDIASRTQQTPQSTLSLTSFFSKAATAIKQKAENSIIKLQQKLAETPSVFVLPLKNRKSSQTENKTVISANQPQNRSKSKQPKQKSKSELSQIDEERLKVLLKKKQQLMLKLRKIDQQLQNPNPWAINSQQRNTSHLSNEYMKNSQLRPIESRLNFKQNHEVNVVQHQKTIQMLSRINNEKMRRQEKLVNDLKKKQELQLKNIQQLEKNKSAIFNVRQEKIAMIRNINKKETEQLLEPSVLPATNEPLQTQQEQIENQFDELQDRQIGSHQKINTEETPLDTVQINQ